MKTQYKTLSLFLLISLLISFPQPLIADDDEEDKLDEINLKIENAIENGLNFLARNQLLDGSFISAYPTATAAIAGLAFLAGGNTCRSGKYAENVNKIANYFVSIYEAKEKPPRWYLTAISGDGSRMHGHGYAMAFLSLVYGGNCFNTKNNEKLDPTLGKLIIAAIHTTQAAQLKSGGFGYDPGDSGDEVTVTGPVLQGLRTARDSGFSVNPSTIRNATSYLRNMAVVRNGYVSFKYNFDSPDALTRQDFLLPVCISALNATGNYGETSYSKGETAEEIQEITSLGLKQIQNNKIEDRSRILNFYGFDLFYSTQAIYTHSHSGSTNENIAQWNNWKLTTLQKLLEIQASNGSWVWQNDSGANFLYQKDEQILTTSFATLALAINLELLPTY